jgi:hypothetical protein
MERIKRLYLYRLRVNEHFEFMRHIGRLVDEYGAEALGVAPQRAALKAAFADEDDALKKILKSAITPHIVDADRDRDETYQGLVNTVRAGQTHFDATRRAAAERLAVVVDTYRNVASMTLEEESSAIHNLLSELVAKHTTDVQELDLEGWIGELDRRNIAFEKLMEARFKERAGQPVVEMTAARRAVDAAYGALSDMVYARALVAEAGGSDAPLIARFRELIGRWNETIDRAADLLARRAAPKKNDGAVGGTGNAAPPSEWNW